MFTDLGADGTFFLSLVCQVQLSSSLAGSLLQHDFDPLRPFNKFSIFSLVAGRERERRRDPFVSCFTLAVSWPSISLDQEESPWQHINVCCLLESCLPALILHILNVPFLLNGEVKDCIFSHSLKETKYRMVVRWGNDSYWRLFRVQKICCGIEVIQC